MKKQLKKATKRRLKLLHKNPDEFWKDVDFIGEDVFYENEAVLNELLEKYAKTIEL